MKAFRLTLMACGILLAVMGTAPVALGAQGRGGPGGWFGARKEQGPLAETPLSADQKQQVRAVLKVHRGEIRLVMKESADARKGLEDTLKANAPDSAATRQAAERVGAAARDRALLRAKLESKIRPILTPEQQRRLDAARAEAWSRADGLLAPGAKL